MATRKQIQAYRRSALPTAIHALTQVLPDEYGGELQALAEDYHRRFQPTTPEQRMFVDTLVDCEWLLRRFRRIERQVFADKTVGLTVSGGETQLPQAFIKAAEVLARLQRRIDSTQRNYRNALRELQRLQAGEAAGQPGRESQAEPRNPPVPAPATLQKQSANYEIGFVPQIPGGTVSTLLPRYNRVARENLSLPGRDCDNICR